MLIRLNCMKSPASKKKYTLPPKYIYIYFGSKLKLLALLSSNLVLNLPLATTLPITVNNFGQN